MFGVLHNKIIPEYCARATRAKTAQDIDGPQGEKIYTLEIAILTTFPNKKKKKRFVVLDSVSLVPFTRASPGGCDVSSSENKKIVWKI